MSNRMTERLPENISNENWRQAIEKDAETTQFRWGVIGLAIFLIVFVLSSTYYCTLPVQQDPNETLRNATVQKQSLMCMSRGGSWMPVITGSHYDARAGTIIDSEMSCVMPQALPLANNMAQQARAK